MRKKILQACAIRWWAFELFICWRSFLVKSICTNSDEISRPWFKSLSDGSIESQTNLRKSFTTKKRYWVTIASLSGITHEKESFPHSYIDCFTLEEGWGGSKVMDIWEQAIRDNFFKQKLGWKKVHTKKYLLNMAQIFINLEESLTPGLKTWAQQMKTSVAYPRKTLTGGEMNTTATPMVDTISIFLWMPHERRFIKSALRQSSGNE